MEGTVPRILKTYFLGSPALAHLFWMVPSLNDGMLSYGARVVPDQSSKTGEKDDKTQEPKSSAAKLYFKLLKMASDLRVPHSWFIHYYMCTCAWSVIWAQQLYTRGPLLQFIAKHTNYAGKPSMTFNQIVLLWVLYQIQGLRRLYESFAFAKPSKSTMSTVIWLVGIVYYTFMNLSMYIEGLPALMSTAKGLGDASISAPSLRTLIFLPLFILASGLQYDCHQYLGSLKQYTIPQHPAFQKVLTPHYLAEVLIYVALSFLGAPKGKLVNKSISVGTIFVLWNLALQADSTKAWYEKKFGKDKVQGRYRMIPYLW